MQVIFKSHDAKEGYLAIIRVTNGRLDFKEINRLLNSNDIVIKQNCTVINV